MRNAKKYALIEKIENGDGSIRWEHRKLYNNIEDADAVFDNFANHSERYGKATKGFKLVERETKQVVKEVYK